MLAAKKSTPAPASIHRLVSFVVDFSGSVGLPIKEATNGGTIVLVVDEQQTRRAVAQGAQLLVQPHGRPGVEYQRQTPRRRPLHPSGPIGSWKLAPTDTGDPPQSFAQRG